MSARTGFLVMSHPQWQALVLDLGGVIFEWAGKSETDPEYDLRSIMRTDLYAQYEMGHIGSEREMCERVGRHLKIDASRVSTTLQIARESLHVNEKLVDCIRELKATTNLAVYAMTNIPLADYHYLQRVHPTAMAIFDKAFTSSQAGLRKPDSNFFKMVIERIHGAPERTIFIDDRPENVDVAKSMGFHTFRFHETGATCEFLHRMTKSI